MLLFSIDNTYYEKAFLTALILLPQKLNERLFSAFEDFDLFLIENPN